VLASGKLANEAFVLEKGVYHPAHHKHYFPSEPGFFETAWFHPEQPGFDAVEASGIRIGVLLCTELFFNEWARHYRRQGVQLIAVPRASGTALERWRTAAAMAAIVSGAYVVSSNRVGRAAKGQVFGGRGFAYAPDGTLIAETSDEEPVVVFELNPEVSIQQQREYPCYVPELG
jgi:N-carbamoylputrescine amidase